VLPLAPSPGWRPLGDGSAAEQPRSAVPAAAGGEGWRIYLPIPRDLWYIENG